MLFQIKLPQHSMIVGQNQGHVTSPAKQVKYKAEVETSNQKIVGSNLIGGKYFKKSKNFFFSVDYKCCLQVEENLLLFPGHSKTGISLCPGNSKRFK